MHDKPSSGSDRAILGLLIDEDCQRPWSVAEIEREIGHDAADGIARLHGAGLRIAWTVSSGPREQRSQPIN